MILNNTATVYPKTYAKDSAGYMTASDGDSFSIKCNLQYKTGAFIISVEGGQQTSNRYVMFTKVDTRLNVNDEVEIDSQRYIMIFIQKWGNHYEVTLRIKED